MRFKQLLLPLVGLLDLLCPPICIICDEVIDHTNDNDGLICPDCIGKIVTPAGQFCRRCGGPRFANANNPNECVRCRTTKFRFQRAIALGRYTNDLRLLTLKTKTDRTGILAISAAKTLAFHRRADLEEVQADYIVPVPMHRFRREDRGVNSPDLIAEELGRQLNIPVIKHLLQRIRSTDLQYTLSKQARAKNVSGAFAIRPNFWTKLGFRGLLPAIAGKNVLLVDDILTTGSTCNEVSKVLLMAGVRSVTVAVLARAEGDGRKN